MDRDAALFGLKCAFTQLGLVITADHGNDIAFTYRNMRGILHLDAVVARYAQGTESQRSELVAGIVANLGDSGAGGAVASH